MPATHTPTPWQHLVDHYKIIHAPSSYIGEWKTVAICSTCDEASANGSFIVRACNAHDDLVKAAKRCRAALAVAVKYAGGEPDEHEAIQQLDAALAKATG